MDYLKALELGRAAELAGGRFFLYLYRCDGGLQSKQGKSAGTVTTQRLVAGICMVFYAGIINRYSRLIFTMEDIFPDRPTSKLYNENAIRVGTFLGGPLVGGYLIADNFREMGETGKVKITWLIAIVSTIALLVLAYVLPESTPKILLPVLYSTGTYSLVQKLQGPKIKAHVAAGGEMRSVWRAVLAGVIGAAILFAFIFGAFYLSNAYFA